VLRPAFLQAQGRFTRASCDFAGCVHRHKIHNCSRKRPQVVEGLRVGLRNYMRFRSRPCGAVESLLRFRMRSDSGSISPKCAHVSSTAFSQVFPVCEFPTRENAGDFSVDSAVMVCIQSSWAPRFRMCCILRFWRAQGRFTRASCVFAGCVPRHKIHNCMMKRAQVVEGRRLRLRNHMRCRSQLCGSVESLLRFRRCSQCANLRPAKTQAISPSTARSGCVSNHLGHRVFTCVASCVFCRSKEGLQEHPAISLVASTGTKFTIA
jgi:hypothetical protein